MRNLSLITALLFCSVVWGQNLKQASIEELLKLCNNDNIRACELINSSVELSPDKFIKLCDGGNNLACSHLEPLLMEQESIRACNNGNFQECESFGIHISEADLSLSQIIPAKNAFENSCNKGHMDSCAYLGGFYLGYEPYGKKIKADLKKAKALYEKACNGNSGSGCAGLGEFYEKGPVVKKDYAQAIKLYEKACNFGYRYSCYDLSELYKDGKKVKKDMNKSYKFRKKMCDLGGMQDECSPEEKKFLEKYK